MAFTIGIDIHIVCSYMGCLSSDHVYPHASRYKITIHLKKRSGGTTSVLMFSTGREYHKSRNHWGYIDLRTNLSSSSKGLVDINALQLSFVTRRNSGSPLIHHISSVVRYRYVCYCDLCKLFWRMAAVFAVYHVFTVWKFPKYVI